MIKNKLDRVEASDADLRDLEQLSFVLSRCKTSKDVLPLLKQELIYRNRDSYVNRIYGRYRKLLPRTDVPELQQWRKEFWAKKNRK